jgi:hypothetical protein
MTVDLVIHLLRQFPDNSPEWLTSAAHIASERLGAAVEAFPLNAPTQEP